MTSPRTTFLERVQHRVPAAWRGPTLGFLTSRPWLFIGLVAAVATAVSGLRFDTYRDVIVNTFLVVALLLPLALTSRAIGGDRTPARWALLFQRPGTVSAHYARTVAIMVLVLVACLLPASSMMVGIGVWRGTAPHTLFGFILGFFVWSLEVLAAGILWTTVSRQRDTELAILYLFFTFMQSLIVEYAHLPHAAAVVLESVLVPFNGSITLWQNLMGAQTPFELRWVFQMIGFPVAVAVIVGIRLRQLGRADLTDVAPD